MACLVDPPPVITADTDFPEVCVEWLPTESPNSPGGDWCDISRYVSLEGNPKTKRGRQYELDRFQAGTFSLTLKASTRLFDPEWTSGPFYSYLIPMRQIRASAVWNGVRYPVFRGFVTSWGQTQPDDVMFVSTISVKDGFERLEQRKLPSSAWALEIVKDDPSAWFRLGESDTVRVTDSSPNGNYGIYDNCQQGQQGLVKNDSDGAATFAHTREERIVIQNNSIISGYPFTVSAMVQVGNDDPGGLKEICTLFADPFGARTHWFALRLTYDADTLPAVGPGRLRVAVNNGADGRALASTVVIDDDQPHHVACVLSSSSSWALYVDGVDVSGTTATAGTGTPAWPGPATGGFAIGNTLDTAAGDFGFGTTDNPAVTADNPYPIKERGTIDEVCIWDGVAVSATRIAAHAAAAIEGWDGDLTGDRVTRFLDVLEWPTVLRDIESGISMLSSASWSAGSSMLSVLQGWADTETGMFFFDADGRLVWWSRHRPLLETAATTSQATFGDGHSAATLKYDNNGLDLPRDETLIRNPVTASRTNGVSVTVKDQTLIDGPLGLGERTWQAPVTEDQKDSSVRDRAEWLLARYKHPASRLARMEISPRRDPTNLWPAVLGLKIGDRITVKRTPLGVGNETSIDVIIEAISHDLGPKKWKTTFVGSPVDPNVGSYMILDDNTYGLLDSALLAY